MTVARHDTNAVDDDQIIAEMLGRGSTGCTRNGKPPPPIGRCASAGVAGQRLRAVDLDLREGEVLGVGGLRTMASASCSGTLRHRRARGSVELWGKPLAGRGRASASPAATGSPWCQEDRRGQGLLLTKGVGENLTFVGHPALFALRASEFGPEGRWSRR
jgi:ABC-type sugar transport system ATPase subunit